MSNFKKNIIFYWEWICTMFGIGFGIFITLVGVIGFIFSENPIKGSLEFAIYGPIIIVVVIKMIKPRRQKT